MTNKKNYIFTELDGLLQQLIEDLQPVAELPA